MTGRGGIRTLRLTVAETIEWRDPASKQGRFRVRSFFVACARHLWRQGQDVAIVDDRGCRVWMKRGDGSEVEWREPPPVTAER